jgi:hypothetical protein
MFQISNLGLLCCLFKLDIGSGYLIMPLDTEWHLTVLLSLSRTRCSRIEHSGIPATNPASLSLIFSFVQDRSMKPIRAGLFDTPGCVV